MSHGPLPPPISKTFRSLVRIFMPTVPTVPIRPFDAVRRSVQGSPAFPQADLPLLHAQYHLPQVFGPSSAICHASRPSQPFPSPGKRETGTSSYWVVRLLLCWAPSIAKCPTPQIPETLPRARPLAIHPYCLRNVLASGPSSIPQHGGKPDEPSNEVRQIDRGGMVCECAGIRLPRHPPFPPESLLRWLRPLRSVSPQIRLN
jgi:hypothetical protein